MKRRPKNIFAPRYPKKRRNGYNVNRDLFYTGVGVLVGATLLGAAAGASQ